MIAEELDGVRQLTERLFSALQRRDAQAAAACYHDDASFSAPIIGEVEGRNVEALWRTIFAATQNSALNFGVVDVGLTTARVEGVLAYSFISSGRGVISRFESVLHIRDQLVVRHEDTFDAWNWARMAFGSEGLMFGWSRTWQRRKGENVRAK
ncbi:MAG: nuclear transport factor 2 family protein [Hyphomicrobium sp.]|nr:nuclear transport factor 2 family protein [Hyphomicrobium sp.]